MTFKLGKQDRKPVRRKVEKIQCKERADGVYQCSLREGHRGYHYCNTMNYSYDQFLYAISWGEVVNG